MSETPKLKMTDFKLTKASTEGFVKAYGTITFNDTIQIEGIKIIEGKKGFFVSWPARKANEKWINIITFVDSDAANEIHEKLCAWMIKQYEDGNFAGKKESSGNYAPKKAPAAAPKVTSAPPVAAPDPVDNDDDLPF